MLASTLFRTTAADALVNYSILYLLQETLNISHRLDGKIADTLASTLAWQLWLTLLSTTVCTCHRDLEFTPWETHVIARCLQGGGVFVYGGTVTISSCTISGNSANLVRAHAQDEFSSPQWENC